MFYSTWIFSAYSGSMWVTVQVNIFSILKIGHIILSFNYTTTIRVKEGILNYTFSVHRPVSAFIMFPMAQMFPKFYPS